MKRLVLERETGHVENQPWIMSATLRPQGFRQTAALIAIILFTN
ncbi:MAG: hypothetical protein ACM3NN_12020 [Nitrospirota bacterium]